MIKDLAIVIVSCDRYSYIWKPWYYYFKKNFGFDYPVYMINETKRANLDSVIEIASKRTDVEQWVVNLKQGIAKIPEEYLFIMMDDFLILKDISDTFDRLYNVFLEIDALRIMQTEASVIKVVNSRYSVDGKPVLRLTQDSDYQISFSPNFWKREFLADCLQTEGNPWHSEMTGSERIKNKGYTVLSYTIHDWFYPAIWRGRVTPEGQKLINKIKP